MLVLDEPFSGLDPVAVDVMSGVLREQAAAGVPVIFSSHQLELVERISDRVGIISAGRMVATGSVEELRSGGEIVIDVRGLRSPGWAAAVPGVTVLDHAGDRTAARRARTGDGVSAGLDPIRVVALVIRREFLNRVRTQAFVLGTLALVVMLGGYLAFITLIGSHGNRGTLGVTPNSAALIQPLRGLGGRPR